MSRRASKLLLRMKVRIVLGSVLFLFILKVL